MVDRGDRRYGGLHVVRRLIVMVDNHKADTTEEQNAVERTYPASPLVVFVKVCGRCDFLEQHALISSSMRKVGQPQIRIRSRSEWFDHSGVGQAVRVPHKLLDVDLADGCPIRRGSSSRD